MKRCYLHDYYIELKQCRRDAMLNPSLPQIEHERHKAVHMEAAETPVPHPEEDEIKFADFLFDRANHL